MGKGGVTTDSLLSRPNRRALFQLLHWIVGEWWCWSVHEDVQSAPFFPFQSASFLTCIPASIRVAAHFQDIGTGIIFWMIRWFCVIPSVVP